jgi:hypothetical protein
VKQPMVDLFDQLDSLPHRADEYELMELVTEWRCGMEVSLIRHAIYDWLKESAFLDQLRTAARETATHYVWPLYVASNGHGLTINEFKDPRYMMNGYANIIHNYRYSFASLILSGGYRQIRSNVEMIEPGQAASIHELGQDDVIEGSMLPVNYDVFHRLTKIRERTVTLLVKCPPAREHSLSVDIDTLRVTSHIPVEARVVELMNSLIMTADAEMAEEK